jgi:hypothetical protein
MIGRGGNQNGFTAAGRDTKPVNAVTISDGSLIADRAA